MEESLILLEESISAIRATVERIEALFEESCYAIRATVKRTDSRAVESLKIGKVWYSCFYSLLNNYDRVKRRQ